MDSITQEKINLLLKKGLSASHISKLLGLKIEIVQKYEEDYIKEIIKNGKSQRLRLRYKLLNDIPLLLEQIKKIADDAVCEPKFQIQAYKSYLSYAIPFLKEDKLAIDIEEEIKEKQENKNLFDFCLPDNGGESFDDNNKKDEENKQIFAYFLHQSDE